MEDEKQKWGIIATTGDEIVGKFLLQTPSNSQFDKRPQQFACAASARLHIFPQT